MWWWQLSGPALVAGVGLGMATEVAVRRCLRKPSRAAVHEEQSESLGDAVEMETEDSMGVTAVSGEEVVAKQADGVYVPPPPALPVLTMKELKRLNRSLGTPLKNKLLLRMGGKDRRTIMDATEDLYNASSLGFEEFVDRVNDATAAVQ